MEKVLAICTQGRSPEHPLSKLVPNCYQYPRGTFRLIRKAGLRFEVDLGECVGHYLHFGFSDPALDHLFGLCHSDSVIVDVGANIGYTVLRMAALARSGRVFAFEPDPGCRGRLKQNLSLNNLDNITLFPFAAGEKKKRSHLESRLASNQGMNRVVAGRKEETEPIQVVRLDKIKELQKLSRLDLIKIDVEGYELKVLVGAEALLRKYQPTLYVEVDDQNLRFYGDTAEKVIQFLLKHGYRSFLRADLGTELDLTCSFENCHFDILAKK